MPELSDFRLGADVVAGDGREVGIHVRVIVDEDALEGTFIMDSVVRVLEGSDPPGSAAFGPVSKLGSITCTGD